MSARPRGVVGAHAVSAFRHDWRQLLLHHHVRLTCGATVLTPPRLRTAKTELRRCIETVAGATFAAPGGSATTTPLRPSSRARGRERDAQLGAQGDAWSASLDMGGGNGGGESVRAKWAHARGGTSSDESADEEAAALLRESRFRSRMGASSSQHAAAREATSRRANGRRYVVPGAAGRQRRARAFKCPGLEPSVVGLRPASAGLAVCGISCLWD